MKKGFTLIELLVVVLIIGILAAIAVPQYTKAVEKSRMAEALTMINSLEKATDMYVLANGYVNAFDVIPNLDIDLGHLTQMDLSGASVSFYCSKNWCYAVTCAAPNLSGSSGNCVVVTVRTTKTGNNMRWEYGLMSQNQGRQGWQRIYGPCEWTGGDVFSSLRALGYTETSCFL